MSCEPLHPDFKEELATFSRPGPGDPLEQITVAFDFEEEDGPEHAEAIFAKTRLPCVRCGRRDVWKSVGYPDDVWFECARCRAAFQIHIDISDESDPGGYCAEMIAALQEAVRKAAGEKVAGRSTRTPRRATAAHS